MSTEKKLLKGSLYPTLIVGAISIALSIWLKGRAGFGGALLAQCVVIIFFAISIAISRITSKADPMMVMMLAMFSYFAKIMFFGLFLILVTKFVPESFCNKYAFGFSAIAATFAWLAGEIRAYLSLKVHLDLPPKNS
jgi:hypothetical protein